jgi:Zn-dependent protease
VTSELKTKLQAKLLEYPRIRKLGKLSRWSKPRKLWGIPVRVHSSVVLLAVLGFFARGPWSVVALAVGLVLHEYAHIWTARALNVKTKRVEITGLGAVAIQGTDAFETYFNNGDVEMKMAAAGPLMNAALASVSFMCATVALMLGLPTTSAVLAEFGFVNILLGCFNMVPIFPMDGGRVLRGFLHQHYCKSLKAKEELNSLFLDLANRIGLVLRGTLIGGGFILPPLIVLYTATKMLRQETKVTQQYIENLQRQRSYVPDPPRAPSRIRWRTRDPWWFDLGLREEPLTFRLAKQAYRKTVLRVHPDRGGNAGEMRVVVCAYETAKRSFGVA